MKTGDRVRLTKEVNEQVLVRMHIRKEVAQQMLKNFREQTFVVEAVTGFGVVVKVNNRNVDLFRKYVEKVE